MKKKALVISLKIGLAIACCVFFIIVNDLITDRNKISFIPVADSDFYAYQIESISIEDNYFVVRGWFFELEKARNTKKNVTNKRKTGIILYDLNGEDKENIEGEKIWEGVALHVEYIDRNDVDAYFRCDYNYEQSGFIAKTEVSNLDLINGKYQIIIKPDSNGIDGILSSAYINNGNLQYVEPGHEIKPDLSDPELNKIVNEGICLASYPENNVYIFQYGWNIYWITGKGFDFDSNEKTVIQFQAFTTQFDKLPSQRLSNGWDNISDTFENYEIKKEENGEYYRVSSRELPKDYSVVSILTGQYKDGQWIWKKVLRPIYSFSK